MAEALSVAELTFNMGSEYPPLYVANFHGLEQLSRLYHLEIDLYADRGGVDRTETAADTIDLEGAIGKPAYVEIKSAWIQAVHGPGFRRFHGIVNRIEQLGRGHGYHRYRVSVVPRVWRLTQRVNCRIFQETNIEEIIKTLLDEHNLKADKDFKISLNQAPTERTYCVQYRESDWDFISRLLEEEGIYYFFKHDDSDKDVIIFGQDPSLHPAIIGSDPKIPYRTLEDGVPTQETIDGFSMGEQIRSGLVRLRDWNFEQPDLKNKGLMEALAPEGGKAQNALEVYEYPGRYANPDAEGKGYAKARLEELSSLRKVGQGTGSCARFMTGHTFDLVRSFRRDFDRSYTLLEVHHSGSAKAGTDEEFDGHCEYRNSFRCIPKDVPFRPARLTPKPAIHGVQTALVVGPEDEEIHTDDRGRIKVKFHWDRSEDMEAPTCWIRVAQTWASPSYGSYFLPRIGQEVVVSFEEGDPDRPLVTGCVYYGATPHKLPDEKTRSIIKTNSSPGGEGTNVLYFEDKKDAEEIYLHGQKDWTIEIENDKNQNVGNNESLTVGANRTKTVKKDQSETVEGNKTISVEKDHTEEIKGKMSLSVTKDYTEEIKGQKEVSVTKDYSISVEGSLTEQVKKDRSISIDGQRDETIKKDSKSEAKTISLDGKDEIKLTAGDAKITLKKDGTVQIDCKDFKLTASGDVKIKASGKVNVEAGGDATLKGGGKVIIKGSQIAEN